MILPNNPTPDISQSDTYVVMNTVDIENLLNGNADDIRYFIFGTTATFKSNSNIKLQGEIDFTGNTGDTLTLIFDGTEWLELSRSLNPIYSGGSLYTYYSDTSYIQQEIENLKNAVTVLQNQMSLMGVTETSYEIVFYAGMTVNDMQYQIDNINKNIVKNAVISIKFDTGLYNISSPLIFTNFNGNGKIKIYSDFTSGLSASKTSILETSNNNSIFQISNCNVEFEFLELHCRSQLENNNNYKGIIEIINSSNVNLNAMYIENYSLYNAGIYFEKSKGFVQDTYVTESKYGIHSHFMSEIAIQNCDDYNNKPLYGIASTNGSRISLFDSQQPKGDISDTYINIASSINA